MPSVLYTASTFSHIVSFHLPYLRRFRELGWQVEVACGGGDVLVIRELQAEGGKRMAAADYFRGHPIEV